MNGAGDVFCELDLFIVMALSGNFCVHFHHFYTDSFV